MGNKNSLLTKKFANQKVAAVVDEKEKFTSVQLTDLRSMFNIYILYTSDHNRRSDVGYSISMFQEKNMVPVENFVTWKKKFEDTYIFTTKKVEDVDRCLLAFCKLTEKEEIVEDLIGYVQTTFRKKCTQSICCNTDNDVNEEKQEDEVTVDTKVQNQNATQVPKKLLQKRVVDSEEVLQEVFSTISSKQTQIESTPENLEKILLNLESILKYLRDHGLEVTDIDMLSCGTVYMMRMRNKPDRTIREFVGSIKYINSHTSIAISFKIFDDLSEVSFEIPLLSLLDENVDVYKIRYENTLSDLKSSGTIRMYIDNVQAPADLNARLTLTESQFQQVIPYLIRQIQAKRLEL